ncbi:branched-chain amino acid ABC transporter permease [Aquamicrobium zhengzhouense]|uniref:Branched-chain amino acid ABC transporter permease n=1 Tax=Aquamicrobium zhengzhouense TaxID=2781738 RepID=A0ABS0SGD8_9HYPH|nr:branched-chain amino acid ABC transporter permease [Aquamicrobium zhengzhouense]MBI1622370.1 branched-chain amino acid ABC transporter permease [Aquamicrobium zhengzhouense]
MTAMLAQLLNGLDKGGAYALIALGLTLVFGTLGVVNFAHGALFMLGCFCAVTFRYLITIETVTVDPTKLTPWGSPVEVRTPLVQNWFGDFGAVMVDYSVPISLILAVPTMLAIGIAMERGLIKHFYKRTHAEQILVTFGLAIVLQEVVKAFFGANPYPQPIPTDLRSAADIGILLGLEPRTLTYPWWRIIYLAFSLFVIGGVFAFLQFTTFGMVVRAGMADRETVGLMGIDIDRRFTIVFGLAAVVAGVAGVMYTPLLPPNYHLGMDFLVLSFVVVVVGGMGSLPGAVVAGFLLGILQSIASMTEIKSLIPGIDQVIIYLVAVIILLVLPRGLMGRRGVMES